MTWNLKDRELEKKLIERYPDFLISLNSDAYSKRGLGFVFLIILWRKINGKNYDDVMTFCTDELEEVPEYNPHAWNEYPKVKPVEPGIYRLEVKHSAGSPTQYFAAVFDFTSEKGWYVYGQGNLINTSFLNGGYVRFRLWED